MGFSEDIGHTGSLTDIHILSSDINGTLGTLDGTAEDIDGASIPSADQNIAVGCQLAAHDIVGVFANRLD